MDLLDPITHHAELISRLGAPLPQELDRLVLPHSMGVAPAPASELAFRFSYRDVPYAGTVMRSGDSALLRLVGNLGLLPFTAQAALRRRRALRTLDAASRDTKLDWRLTERHEIVVSGEAPLARPLTPGAIVTVAVGLLVREEGYLKLLLDVLGEAGYLNSSEAA